MFAPRLTALQKEMQAYEVLPDSDEVFELLPCWKNHADQFPLLAFLVRVLFTIPAASSKSEKVFSVAGRIVSPDRNRLAPELVENLVIMKCNLRLLREMKT